MMEDFVEFWKIELPSGQPNLHPKDRQWMGRHWPDPLRYPLYKNWDEYAASDRFGSYDKALHLSLIPTPYLGNLRDAKVLLFMANPGFADADYYFEDQPGIRERLIFTFTKNPTAISPSFSSIPDWRGRAASGGGKSCYAALLAVLVSRRRTRIQAMEFLSQSIAAVELFPYHSMDGSELKRVDGKLLMPSVSEARNFFARSSHNPEQLTVLARAHERWLSPSCAEACEHHLHRPRHQAISLDPKFKTGEKY